MKLSIISIFFILVSLFLRSIGSIAVPIFFGAILGFVFASIVEVLVSKKIPFQLTIPLTIIFFLIASFLFISLVTISIQALDDKFSLYQTKAVDVIKLISQEFPFIDNEILLQIQNKIFSFVTNTLLSISKGLFSFLTAFIIALLIMVFVLFERHYLPKKLALIFSNDQKKARRILELISNMNSQVTRFILVKFFISALTGSIIYISFLFIGVDFPIVWALFTFILNFIPNIGSLVITIASVTFSFIQFFPEWKSIILVFCVMTVTQMIIGNVLDPMITSDRLNLSPLIVFLSLLYWGWVWGPGGMFMSVPMVVVLRVVFEAFPATYKWSLAMGNARTAYKKKLSIMK